MNILAITNHTASHLWRITPYLEYAEKQGNGVMVHTVGTNVDETEFMWADIVIIEMVLEKNIIDLAHKCGCIVIYEIDDLIEKVTKNHPNYINMKRLTTIWRTFRCIHASDIMFCSNKEIKKRYGWMAKETFVMPNYLDLHYWLKPPFPNDGPYIRIGWAGSFAHYDDLKFFQPILKKLLDKYPKIKFIYVGMGGWHGGSAYSKFNYGEDLFNEIPVERREYHQGVESKFWAAKLNSLQLDIGVAPVVDNIFSRAKTPIKWLEYAVNYIPFVGSKCLYGEDVKHKKDGFVAETAEQFYTYLCRLIEDKELRQQMGMKAHQRAINDYDITKFQVIWLKKLIQLHNSLPMSYRRKKESAKKKFQEAMKKREKQLHPSKSRENQ